MAFIIENIREQNPLPDHRYFLDTNVWLAILADTFNTKRYRPYLEFFNKIIDWSGKDSPKIAITNLLLAEVINRMIHSIHYPEYKAINTPVPGESDREHFKKTYRPSEQYAIDLESVCRDIRSYHNRIEFVSDNLDQYNCRDLIKNIPQHLDINDYLLGKIALSQGLIVVTDDSDFLIEDVTVFTANSELLANMKTT